MAETVERPCEFMATDHLPLHIAGHARFGSIVVHSWDEVPEFANECEEHELWSTHEMGDEFFENVDPDAEAELPPPRTRRSSSRRQAGS